MYIYIYIITRQVPKTMLFCRHWSSTRHRRRTVYSFLYTCVPHPHPAPTNITVYPATIYLLNTHTRHIIRIGTRDHARTHSSNNHLERVFILIDRCRKINILLYIIFSSAAPRRTLLVCIWYT